MYRPYKTKRKFRTHMKLVFRERMRIARLTGICCRCNHEVVPGTTQCQEHTLRARERHRKWRESPEVQAHLKSYQKKRREHWQAKGRCHHCAQHRPLAEGRRKCKACLKKYRAYDKRREVPLGEALVGLGIDLSGIQGDAK